MEKEKHIAEESSEENIVPAELTKTLDEIREKPPEEGGEEITPEKEKKGEGVSEEVSKTEVDEEKEEIDPRLVAAGKRRGWSDDKIIKTAESDESILEDLAELYDDIDSRPAKTEPAKKAEEKVSRKDEISKTKVDEALTKLSEQYGDDVVADVIRPMAEKQDALVDELNTIKGQMGQFREDKEISAKAQNLKTANEVFDSESEAFPALGKTEDLPLKPDGTYDERSPAFKERARIYDTAEMFAARGMSFKSAMAEAFKWYAGDGAEKVAGDKIVKALNARKKKFSPRPTRRKGEVKTYATKDEQHIAEIQEAKVKAGIVK